MTPIKAGRFEKKQSENRKQLYKIKNMMIKMKYWMEGLEERAEKNHLEKVKKKTKREKWKIVERW